MPKSPSTTRPVQRAKEKPKTPHAHGPQPQPQSGPLADLLALQHAAGNRAVGQLLGGAQALPVQRAPQGGQPAQAAPARGTFIVAPLKGGGYVYTFNGEDALSWDNRARMIFRYYMNDNFPGISEAAINDLVVALQVELLLDVKDEAIKKANKVDITFDGDTENAIRTKMRKSYPQFAPSRPQSGARALTDNKAPAPGGQPQGVPTTVPPKTEGSPAQTPPAPVDLSEEDKKLAEQLDRMMKGAKTRSKVDPKELIRLYRVLQAAVKDPMFAENGQSMVKFAKFLELNKDKIQGLFESSQKGNLSQENIETVIAEYGKFIAAETVESRAEKLEKVEDFDKEFKYDPGWQELSPLDRKLLVDYAKLRPDEIVDQKVDFKKVSANMKVTMALKLADKTVMGALKDAAEAAFSDPTFVVTLVVMMAIYVGLWLTPDPTLITKLAAGTLTVALLMQFAWDDIIGTVKAWGALKDECDVSFDVDQLRNAGNKFIQKLGTVGFDILMFIVMWRVGKKVGPKVQKIGADRAVTRAEGKLAAAEQQPGSGKVPQAAPGAPNLLNAAKTAAPEPANPASVLDTLAKSLEGDAKAKTGLENLRKKAGDKGALAALEGESARGTDLKNYLAGKGMSDAAIAAAKADVAKAQVALARAKLIAAETIKDPVLREKARAEQFNALLEVLRKHGILSDARVQKALTSRKLDGLISAIGEAIARQKLRARPDYAGNKNFKIRTNLIIVELLKGFKSVAEWRAAEKAKAKKVKPGTPEAAKLEKDLSRAAARLVEKDGKVYTALGEIDLMMTRLVKGGKPQPVEISEVKTGANDKGASSMGQLDKSTIGLAKLAQKEPGVFLFERVGQNNLGKDLTAEFDLANLSDLKQSTFGLEGKSGFSDPLGITEATIIELAVSLVESLPPKGTTPSLPPTKDDNDD